jgi:ribokinase
MPAIAVIGSLNMDIVAVAPRLPVAGETLTGLQFLNVPGGKGANQAYATARLGGNVAMFGRVGADDYGARMRANLEEVGCDVSALQSIEGSSGVAVIFVGRQGENAIVVVPGANERYLPQAFQADAVSLREARCVLLQLETPMDTVIAAAQHGRRLRAQVILDPAPAPGGLSLTLLSQVDILTPNESEASQLLGSPPHPLNLEEARAISRRLLRMGVRSVIIKLGIQGCLVAEDKMTAEIPAPKVNVVDTTGAGDVFNAALAVSLSEGASLTEASRFAVRAASLSVTRLGAQKSVPSRAEVNLFI